MFRRVVISTSHMSPLLCFISTCIKGWLLHTIAHFNHNFRVISSNVFVIKLCIFTHLVCRVFNF
uniref:Uncharacterized protein MANES_15G005300 n=1 Tax=Rhizophora mucronata TaxID=61149 RepID=A0A2P2MC00_RHIMU